MSFLSAEWRKLLMVNYEVDPKLIKPYLPYRTELDTWNKVNFVSLVAFLFKNTRLLGFPIPFHRNFEEVNLRFYVRYREGKTWKRGVVFLKEIVPKPALSWVANTVYREHYETCPMGHQFEKVKNVQHIAYHWNYKGKTQMLQAKTHLEAQFIQEASEEEFITEHYWGYTRVNAQKTYEYQVTHPRWEHYLVKDYQVNVDYAWVYGPRFGDLNSQIPRSVLVAEGSPISVENKRKI